MEPETGRLSPGDVLIETYEIERLLGVGGSGEVYLAHNVVSGDWVAIKILRALYAKNETFIELMRRELLRSRDFFTDAAVRYYDLLQTRGYGGLHFLVMEYIEGRALADLMAEGPVDTATLLAVARRVAMGLREAHDAGVLHRDVSPSNILLRGGDPDRATLIDFGIAKDLRPEAAGATLFQGGFAGTYEYSAPEQIDGEPDARSDLYALGATLAAAARGRVPELAYTLSEIRRDKAAPPRVDDLDPVLGRLVARLTAPDPTDRPASATELLALLERGPEARSARPAPGPRRAPPMPEPSPARTPSRTGRAGAGTRTPPPRGMGGSADADARPGGALALGAAAVATVLVAAGALVAALHPDPAAILDEPLTLGGLIETGPPPVVPYRLVAVKDEGVTLDGYAPSQEVRRALLYAAGGGGTGDKDVGALTIAPGVPGPDWASGVAGLLGVLGDLATGRLDVVDDRAVLRGEIAGDEAARAALETRARGAAATGALTLDLALAIAAPPGPDPERIMALLEAFDACAGLSLAGGAAALEGTGPVTVEGRVASADTAADLRTALGRELDDRTLDLDLTTLNPSVCRVLGMLEIAPETDLPGFGLVYTDGESGEVVGGDVFGREANPVIDVAVPEGAAGRLHVLLVNDDGSVVSFLPHLGRRENRLDRLLEGEARTVRIAYPCGERTARQREAGICPDLSEARKGIDGFGPPYGTNLVLALIAPEDLYDPMRLSLESIEEVAPELAAGLASAAERGEGVAVAHRLLIPAAQ